MKDLTQSAIDRQNILNNNEAIEKIQNHIGLVGLLYEGEYLFTSKMVADFFDVTTRTLTNILNENEDEVKHNGYQVIKGQKLKEFKDLFGPLLTSADDLSQKETDFPLSKQNTDNQSFKRLKSLAVFNFRAFLNIAMLLSESENAKRLRSKILDIVIDTLNQKIGGSTKFINQRDEEFLVAITREPIYRKEFTSALNLYLEMGTYKYAVYTDAIYQAIFKENAKEYKAILNLEEKDNPRDTMYAEVLKLIASFEVGIADEMKEKSEHLGRKLTPSELNVLIMRFSKKRHWIPLIEDACTKMASRDYGLRNVIHKRLENYIGALSKEDYSRFLGDKSKSLIDRVIENPELLEVFKRLKDR
ncbi:DNA-binding protein [Jiulongibacter sediminis]|uniref:DNA-binding protein n=1 Tax=Jiulongibacter sediminis TaxID=1605367 RepID=UPI0026E9B59D|nr:DNA-binding protein [Jiulongibacter sediminis]